jgi:hypothetical protein
MIKEILRIENESTIALLKIEASTNDFLDVILSLQEKGYKVNVIDKKEYDLLRNLHTPSYTAKPQNAN